MSLQNVVPAGTKLSVSQTLPGSSKKHLLNPSSSTGENPPWSCTAPSSLHLVFPTSSPIRPTHIAMSFQGGFVGTSVNVWVAEEKVEEEKSEKGGDVVLGLELGGKVHPEDRNRRQVFEIPYPPAGAIPFESAGEPQPLPSMRELKLEFERSSDHYGRVTLYSLELLGP